MMNEFSLYLAASRLAGSPRVSTLDGTKTPFLFQVRHATYSLSVPGPHSRILDRQEEYHEGPEARPQVLPRHVDIRVLHRVRARGRRHVAGVGTRDCRCSHAHEGRAAHRVAAHSADETRLPDMQGDDEG